MEKAFFVSPQGIQSAESRLKPYIKKSSLLRSDFFSERLKTNVFFKWETEQDIKSFKIRGALNKILTLTEKEKSHGLIAASAGNHAQGVAFAGKLLNIKTRIVMMENASKVKISATKKWGAEVILKGKNYDESYQYAKSIKGGSVFIHPFADPKVIEGQGTLGLEIFKDLPELDSLIVPTGGGGLLCGTAVALKSLKPSIKVYGVVWEGTPDFCRNFNRISKDEDCLCQKKIKNEISKSGLTDGIAVRQSRKEMLELSSQYVSAVCCVSEEEISSALVLISKLKNKTVEGSGASALAGLLKYHSQWDLGKNCCVLISGANIDPEILSQIING